MDSEDRGNRVVGLLAGMVRELTCRLCLELYKEATTTFCGHTFCNKCITQELSKSEGRCPTCKYKLTTDLLNPAESFQQIVDEFKTIKDDFESTADVNLSEAKAINIPSGAVTDSIASTQEASLDTGIEGQSANPRDETQQAKKYHIMQWNENPITEIQNIPNVTLGVKKMTPEITHLVLDADNNLLVKNDTKYRLAILYGCYIVNPNWLKISKEKGYMMPEERFEIQGDLEHGRTGAPRKARRNKELKKQNLFYGLKVDLINDSNKSYHKLIHIGRGEISDEYDDVIVCNSSHFTDEQVEELKNKYPTKSLISRKWVEDCICNYELIKKDDYLL